MRSIFTYGSLIAASALLAGCASDGGGNATGRHDHLSGMACPTCETVWVQESGGTAGGSKVTPMRWGRQMTCPDCDAMAEAYFKDGEKVLHDCPTCKVAPRPARPASSPPSHPKGTHT
ncbi:MAG TPA: hypothetical protein VFB66_06665 [Tepidisphaeraceae bacterium]|nr:hypothetical protein [Tepidisphaeraceae bacterium]